MSPPSLPDLSAEELARELEAVSPEALSGPALAALAAHYRELRRWNRTLSLIGPGTTQEVVGRHYGEALAALPLVPREAAALLDVGSGAGFPGFILAAARPGLSATLVEARERKWAFLQAAARRAGLPILCLNARVGPSLPEGVPSRLDLVTVRALKLEPEVMAALAERLSPTGRFLLWAGADDPLPPPGWRLSLEEALPGSRARRIVGLCRR